MLMPKHGRANAEKIQQKQQQGFGRYFIVFLQKEN
jgi:hypothetical protein